MLCFCARSPRKLSPQICTSKWLFVKYNRSYHANAVSVTAPASLLGPILFRDRGPLGLQELAGQVLRNDTPATFNNALPQEEGRGRHHDSSAGARAASDQPKEQPHLEGSFFTTDSAVTELQVENSIFEEAALDPELERQDASPDYIAQTHRKLKTLLDGKQDDAAVAELSGLLETGAVVASLKATTFLEILRWLDPNSEALPLRQEYATRLPKHIRRFRQSTGRTLHSLMQRKKAFTRLCSKRIKHFGSFSLPEYSQMLQCARAMYDGHTASLLLRKMRRQDIKPDLACYNAFFAAKCWSDAWHPLERQRLRVFPYTMQQREGEKDIKPWKGYQLQSYRVGPHGILKEVSKAFNEMIESEIVADREAFEHLLTAFAREGDTEGVKMILKNAWDFDVDADVSKVTVSMPLDSPMYPDQSTLFAVAHAFGINNDVSTALRAVVMLSEAFSVPIGQSVWTELLEWTYMLSTPRHKNRKWDGAQLGQLPKRMPEELWRILRNEPYNCEPTLRMCDIMVCSMARRDRLLPMIEHMQIAVNRCRARAAQHASDKDETGVLVGYMGKWLELLLYGQWRFAGSKSTPGRRSMQRELVPDMVEIFWPYRNREIVRYSMETGYVEMRDLAVGSPPMTFRTTINT